MQNTEISEKKPDIFDRIMSTGFLKRFEPLYKQYKEPLMYLFFGVLTTLVNFVTAAIVKSLLSGAGVGNGWVTRISTFIAWVAGVAFAYVTNRIWVFDSKAKGAKDISLEALSFTGGRLFTYFVEAVMMEVGNVRLGFNYWATKITANVVVVILNYIISKLIVFRKPKNSNV